MCLRKERKEQTFLMCLRKERKEQTFLAATSLSPDDLLLSTRELRPPRGDRF